MNILIFGDSIAQGMWDSRGGWVSRMSNHFYEKANLNIADNTEDAKWISIFNLGICGDTCADIMERFESEFSARRSDETEIIIIAVGVNDSQTTTSESDLPTITSAEYKQQLNQLVDKCKKYQNADSIILLGLTPCVQSKVDPNPWGEETVFTNERIQEFDGCIAEVAQAQEVTWIPIIEPFSENMNDSWLPDGIHPNEEGHEFIKNIVIEQVQSKIDNYYKS